MLSDWLSKRLSDWLSDAVAEVAEFSAKLELSLSNNPTKSI